MMSSIEATHGDDDYGSGDEGQEEQDPLFEEAEEKPLPLPFFRNIPCLACGSNCAIKSEAEGEEPPTPTLAGNELKIFCQLLKIKSGWKSGWRGSSEGGEGMVPICNSCRRRISYLDDLERKLRRLGQTFRNGLRDFKKLCEEAEGVFEREGIYDLDGRYFTLRKQIGGARLPTRPRRNTGTETVKAEKIPYLDNPEAMIREERALRRSKSRGAESLPPAVPFQAPIASVPADEKIGKDPDPIQVPDHDDTSNNADDDCGDEVDSFEEKTFEDEQQRQPKRKTPSRSKADMSKRIKSDPDPKTVTPGSPSTSRSGARRRRKLSKVEVEDGIDLDDLEFEAEMIRSKQWIPQREEEDSDFEPDEKQKAQEESEDEDWGEDLGDSYKERTQHDPTTGLYTVLHVQFQPVKDEPNKLECLECHEICKKISIRGHMFRCHTSMFKCRVEDCGKTFGSAARLKEHVLFVHKKIQRPQKRRIHDCPTCGKPCPSLGIYRRHLTTHYSEQDKAEALARGEQLLTFANRTKLQCDHCGKNFQSTHYLKRHLLAMHPQPEDAEALRERKELCPECGALVDKKTLPIHRRRLHNIGKDGQDLGIEAVRRFICSFCDKRFINSRELVRHRKSVHEKIYDFQCSLCPRQFTFKEQLTRHMNSHNNIRNFPCPHCPMAFFSGNNLKRHVKTYHTEGGKPGRKSYVRGATSGKQKQKPKNTNPPPEPTTSTSTAPSNPNSKSSEDSRLINGAQGLSTAGRDLATHFFPGLGQN